MISNSKVEKKYKSTLQCDVTFTARTVSTLQCTKHINSTADTTDLTVVDSPVRCTQLGKGPEGVSSREGGFGGRCNNGLFRSREKTVRLRRCLRRLLVHHVDVMRTRSGEATLGRANRKAHIAGFRVRTIPSLAT